MYYSGRLENLKFFQMISVLYNTAEKIIKGEGEVI